VNFYASIMLHDFGDRSGMNEMESEDQSLAALYTFGGTDTFAGAYQAWMNSGKTPGIGISVNALAHRNVQAYEFEGDCYEAIYNASGDNEIISMVNDCYHSRTAVKKYQLPLALRSKNEGNGKVVVSRPDSGDPLQEVMFIIQTAIDAGLYENVELEGKTWTTGTFLKFIEGDGMTYEVMEMIIRHLLDNGHIPWAWGLFGQGGGQRNFLKRDNLSAKFALCAIGVEDEGRVKFSDTFGKTTLPGPFKILRTPEALAAKRTVVFRNEEGIDARVVYYNGRQFNGEIGSWAGPGMFDDFNVIKERSHEQFDTYPKTLHTETNHGYPASVAIIEKRRELLEQYAPDKNTADY
jgi:nicotinic acid phosphoribosyltransferase